MTGASPPAVEAEGLGKDFGEVRAVDGVSFRIDAAETVGLLGGNGAGKTTTIAMMLGLLTPSAGRVRVFGHDMRTERARALPVMNFASPYVELPKRLTVRENLNVYGRLYGIRDRAGRIAELGRELDVARFFDRPLGSLSAGQVTRVSLAKALLNDPRLLLLDEPTASLDPDTGDRMRGYLEDWRRRAGGAIVLASHNMGEVERMCDRVLMMRAGRIVDTGAPADLIARHGRRTLEEVFLHIARNAGPESAA